MEFDEKRLRRWTDPLEGFIDAGPLQDCLAELDRLRAIEDAARAFIDTGSTLHHNELVRLLEAT